MMLAGGRRRELGRVKAAEAGIVETQKSDPEVPNGTW